MVLPGGDRRLTINFVIWIQYTNVTDSQTDRQRPTTSTAPTHNVARQKRRVRASQDIFVIIHADTLSIRRDRQMLFDGHKTHRCVIYIRVWV